MTIDLRSDTVTRPSTAMRQAMAQAQVGDDVYGEDPTVARLEAEAAALLGTEAALFAPSGTQTNLIALLTHCGRGDEYIAGQEAHTYRYEGGGAAALGGIQPQPLSFEPDGTLDLDRVARAIKPPDFHFARTRLLCLEDTQAGKPLPLGYAQRARALADAHGLAMHLDGARLFNAATFHDIPPRQLAAPFDSVSICLSKGLGAPIGSILCGRRPWIEEARRWRKMTGGGMRQAGIVAAAGLVALREGPVRLALDHARADQLGAGLAALPGFEVLSVATNMVFLGFDPAWRESLACWLKEHGVLVFAECPMRLVTHVDVPEAAIPEVIDAFASFERRSSAG